MLFKFEIPRKKTQFSGNAKSRYRTLSSSTPGGVGCLHSSSIQNIVGIEFGIVFFRNN